MQIKTVILLILISSQVFSCYSCFEVSKQQMKEVIDTMYSQLQEEQVKKSQDFKKFPPQMQTQKGLYGSEVKLNLIDADNSELPHLFRETFGVFDNNMFVTNFVLMGIIETADLGYITVDNQSLTDALDALLTFKDKNQKNSTTPIYNFWSQIYVNGTWTSYPENLENMATIFEGLPQWLQKIIAVIGINPAEMQKLVKSFKIPPDNDDSALNVALGSVLRTHKDKFPSLQAKWESENSDYSSLYAASKKYSYKPLNSIHNVINFVFIIKKKIHKILFFKIHFLNILTKWFRFLFILKMNEVINYKQTIS